MDYLHLLDEDLTELYRLHSGHKLFENSDGSSTISESNELLDDNEPPLYTYEELKANLGEFQPENETALFVKGDGYTGANITPEQIVTNIGLRTVNFACYICNLSFYSQDLLSTHKTNFPHCQLYKMKMDLISQGITSEYWHLRKKNCILCILCNVNMQAPLPSADHLKSRGHRELLKQWIKQRIVTKKVDRHLYCDVCDLKLDGTSEIQFHYQGKIHLEQAAKHLSSIEENAKWFSDIGTSDINGKRGDDLILETELDHNETFYCYACNLKFASQNDLDTHCQEVLHDTVVGLKHFLISKGISQAEYWRLLTLQLDCVLCHVMLTNDSAIDSHLKSRRHKSKLFEWMQLQTKGWMHPNYKWFRCNLCNIKLDGTTNAGKHYHHESHIRNQTKANGELVSASSLVGYSQSRPIQPSLAAARDKETCLLKHKVLTQIQQFMDNIYFSKRIPFKIALNCIQKYNEEFERL